MLLPLICDVITVSRITDAYDISYNKQLPAESLCTQTISCISMLVLGTIAASTVSLQYQNHVSLRENSKNYL